MHKIQKKKHRMYTQNRQSGKRKGNMKEARPNYHTSTTMGDYFPPAVPNNPQLSVGMWSSDFEARVARCSIMYVTCRFDLMHYRNIRVSVLCSAWS